MADTDCASECASSVGDEERVRRLFQACDQNGDGYIDSQDLLAICKELSLEDSLDELMLQLGADSQGRISYEQFLNRRLALRPEIDALKNTNKDNTSEHSQGKLDSWEWDSGARDMSPVPKTISRKYKEKYADDECFKERLQQQLDEQAQRYEEQLTELHSVIAELTRKLHRQRTLAIAEEDEISESCTSAHEESVTCPLEVSELEPLENESSDIDNKLTLSESPVELPEPKLTSSNNEANDYNGFSDVVDPLKQEIANLKRQLHEAEQKIAQLKDETTYNGKTLESPESHTETDCEPVRPRFGNVANKIPVPKMAERIKLKTAADEKNITANELVSVDLPTSVAETIVGDILRQCDLQSVDVELRKTNAKLEHARSQNAVLALTLSETKAHCERLALLCGKYESNALALRLALGLSDRAIEAYDVLLALLETELALEGDDNSKSDRLAAEAVARRLLAHLDEAGAAPAAAAPWGDRHVYAATGNDDESSEPWSSTQEHRLREHVSRLKAERSRVRGTCVVLESPHSDPPLGRPPTTNESRRLDLETAVLIQELMGLREDRAELLSRLLNAERDLSGAELRLKRAEERRRAQAQALRGLRFQLQEAGEQLARRGGEEHERGVELELAQALEREGRLRLRLQELGAALERATRQLDGKEGTQDGSGGEIQREGGNILSDSMEKCGRKHNLKFRRMEHQMQTMMDKNIAQVHNLHPKISTLETPPTNSSENSANSLAV